MAAGIVEVAVELPVHGTFHYSVPEAAQSLTHVGTRVLVPFGHRGVSGVVTRVDAELPEGVKPRPIDAVVDAKPLIPEELVELALWVANYYQAPVGEVLKVALPVGAQISGSQMVVLTEAGREIAAGRGGARPRGHLDVIHRLATANGRMAQSKLRKSARGADLSALMADGLIEIELRFGAARVKAKKQKRVRLRSEAARTLEQTLRRSPKQLAVAQTLHAHGGEASLEELKMVEPRAASHVRSLQAAGIVDVEEQVVHGDAWQSISRGSEGMVAPTQAPVLAPAQTRALEQIQAGLAGAEYKSFVLHGITGSGKTEVYLGAVADALDGGGGALVLVPEISLTPQLAARFRARFGDSVAVLHSGLTDRERYDEWHRIRSGQARIALGARSAVFAPVRNLAIICVDEEHDPSFKQEEGVRYHARDVALVRARNQQVVCVLGSATPSLESFYGAKAGRHQLLEMPERATPRPLPAVEVVDLKVYKPDKGSLLSMPLRERLAETLAAGDQAIVFLNRRGFDTFVVCVACGHSFRCPHCSVSLTYHKASGTMACHHCGYIGRLSETCPSCRAEGTISRRGIGTEKIAEALEEAFPDARIGRLDRDVGNASEVQRILGTMARGEIDVLVGTQMVTKGHDFPGVTLVGVLLADTSLSFPDFRASERTFQLLTQVAGRAGRGERSGRVVIQTYRPEAEAIRAAQGHDYKQFYDNEVTERRDLGYPPAGYLVAVRVDGKDPAEVKRVAREVAERARRAGSIDLLGPTEAPLARIAGRTRWHLWLRGDDRQSVRRASHLAVPRDARFGRGIRVVVDVDPISAL